MTDYKPPFNITPKILAHVAEISEIVGQISTADNELLPPQLRRSNRIKTIQASLAIENNTLSLEQVTAVLDGKRVLGLPQEIQEVRNAFSAYEELPKWQADNFMDLLHAHKLLMSGLIDDAGHLRRGDVGIYRGEQLLHMAPPASIVDERMRDLLHWLDDTDLHPLISSCVFHYEFEFIHPFSDGNGRLGRLWQTLILSKWRSVLIYLPVETVIRDQQGAYYRALAAADRDADSTIFVEFMLQALLLAVRELVAQEEKTRVVTPVKTRVKTPDLIMQALARDPELTISDLAEHCGKSPSAIERAIAKLRQQGKLKRIGPKKGGHWMVI